MSRFQWLTYAVLGERLVEEIEVPYPIGCKPDESRTFFERHIMKVISADDVYRTLTSNPEVWNQTLLIVTFDEHGGTYDHFPPPWNVIIWNARVQNFSFA